MAHLQHPCALPGSSALDDDLTTAATAGEVIVGAARRAPAAIARSRSSSVRMPVERGRRGGPAAPGTADLATRWRNLRAARPAVRTREAAAKLGVSEAELIASMVGDGAVRIEANPADLLYALTEVGPCTALTRNQHAVGVVRGSYGGIELGMHTAQIDGEQIALLAVLDHWRHLYAFDEPDPRRPGERRRSIHAFDRTGAGIHKIYLAPDGDAPTWDAIVATRLSDAPLVIQPAAPIRRERSDASIDRIALRRDWDAMQSIDELPALLDHHGATRPQALRLVGEPRARWVADGEPGEIIERLLEAVITAGEAVTICIGNPGCLHRFTGVLDQIAQHAGWIDVLAPGFDLHIRADRIAASWVLDTQAGAVLELLDADGASIAQVLPRRSARGAEDPAWRGLLEGLPGSRR